MSPKPALLLISLVVLLPACSDPVARQEIAIPVLRFATAEQRHDCLRSLQAAWQDRPRETTAGHRRAERRFLKALGGYLSRIKDSREFVAACVTWNECVRDHVQQYGEIDL